MDNPQLKALVQNIIQADESLIDRLLSHFPTKEGLLHATQHDLQHVKGITPHKARILHAAFQIAKEMHRPREPTYIRSPKDVFDLLSIDLKYRHQEYFVCVFLNTKNRIIGYEVLAIGTLNAAIVHPREVYRSAIKRSAASIICAHNHPSGDPTPSECDIELTERLMSSGRIVGIDMLDHVIIGGDSYFSLKEQGVV